MAWWVIKPAPAKPIRAAVFVALSGWVGISGTGADVTRSTDAHGRIKSAHAVRPALTRAAVLIDRPTQASQGCHFPVNFFTRTVWQQSVAAASSPAERLEHEQITNNQSWERSRQTLWWWTCEAAGPAGLFFKPQTHKTESFCYFKSWSSSDVY